MSAAASMIAKAATLFWSLLCFSLAEASFWITALVSFSKGHVIAKYLL
jgi:hypothetical protein